MFHRFHRSQHVEHTEEKWAWPWAKELPKILEFPFNIYATAEASNFKFGTQLGFAKGHHKVTPKRKHQKLEL